MWYRNFLLVGLWFCLCRSEFCIRNSDDSQDCRQQVAGEELSKYSREKNDEWTVLRGKVLSAFEDYKECSAKNCSCHSGVIVNDLSNFKNGITPQMIKAAESKGTKYQIINHRLYRAKACMFPARCAGVEHFLFKMKSKLPDTEFILNTRDWPQISRYHNQLQPVFSFSKTHEYYDILYPAWSFWEGGPAIKLYPTGLGRWDRHRESLKEASDAWDWEKKSDVAFFRGSRTTEERDPLILLSREEPSLVDAAYTKNQAWKSNADTLNVPPAAEVALEDHCRFKYLFNFRGVAASFRLKHLFLCKSLVFHVGEEWFEFFYPALKPWVHYVPVKSGATKEEIKHLLTFVKNNDDIARKIAEEGYTFIWNHLQMKDVTCYWRKLLRRYSKLLTYKPSLDEKLMEVKHTN
ncbi:O-glucosyltransferase rumi-like protein [Frankliniella fusca]|uniref:O-glucosyltransferase rumi-like protein n=1 Tax=Frankliniella fusca TaxID=407009 RepID=A0AAE1H5V9_9NEOP|nr:O-glucosyltransferase rumi-like protein [Frankliniella fusca]